MSAPPDILRLFRAVSIAEFDDLMATRTFRAIASSIDGKFFALSVDDATRWGRAFGGPFRVISADLPVEDAEALIRWDQRLDGIGYAVFGEISQLKRAIIRAVES